jgi:hypothetical protein
VPERAIDLLANGRALTELHEVGPFIAKQLRVWMEKPPRAIAAPPAIRRDFLTLAEAKVILVANPDWTKLLRGDLQMHTRWSDGSGSVKEMAQAGEERDYEYLAITDHSKGLKIAGGIDEVALAKQTFGTIRACVSRYITLWSDTRRHVRSEEKSRDLPPPRGIGRVIDCVVRGIGLEPQFFRAGVLVM